MKKFIVLLLTYNFLFPIVGVSAEKRLVLMPEGYTKERITEFIQQTLGSDEFRQSTVSQFPSIDNYKGKLICIPVWTKSIAGIKSGGGILCKTKGFEKWPKEEEFISYVETYFKKEKSR